jgi:hypothetical protein
VLVFGALNAIAYRFAALAEYDRNFTDSFNTHGGGPGQPFRYDQERDLFGFFNTHTRCLSPFASHFSQSVH